MTEWSASIQNAGSAVDWQEKLNLSLNNKQWSSTIQPIADKLANGVRLSVDDGDILYRHNNLSELAMLAHLV